MRGDSERHTLFCYIVSIRSTGVSFSSFCIILRAYSVHHLIMYRSGLLLTNRNEAGMSAPGDRASLSISFSACLPPHSFDLRR